MKKLELNKKIISSLSDAEMAKVNGGLEQEAGTTSFGRCSRGFICCGSLADTCGGGGGSFIITGCPKPATNLEMGE